MRQQQQQQLQRQQQREEEWQQQTQHQKHQHQESTNCVHKTVQLPGAVFPSADAPSVVSKADTPCRPTLSQDLLGKYSTGLQRLGLGSSDVQNVVEDHKLLGTSESAPQLRAPTPVCRSRPNSRPSLDDTMDMCNSSAVCPKWVHPFVAHPRFSSQDLEAQHAQNLSPKKRRKVHCGCKRAWP